MSGVMATFALAFGLAFSESGLGLGMVVPGETAVVVIAATMHAGPELVVLGVVVALGASLGDHVGYGLGLRYGDRLRDTRPVRRVGARQYDRALDLLHRRGGLAVFATRLVPVVRTLTPAAAGAAGLEYRRFLPASLAGSALWSAAYVVGGSVAAAVTALARDTFGAAAWLLIVAIAAVVLPLALVRAVAGRPARTTPELARFELDRFEPLLTR